MNDKTKAREESDVRFLKDILERGDEALLDSELPPLAGADPAGPNPAGPAPADGPRAPAPTPAEPAASCAAEPETEAPAEPPAPAETTTDVPIWAIDAAPDAVPDPVSAPDPTPAPAAEPESAEASVAELARAAMQNMIEPVQPPSQPPTPASPAAAAGGRAKTRLIGFHHATVAEPDVFTRPSASPSPAQQDFPVGWLVVTAGPGRGAQFTLINGVSTIGRGTGQTVQLDFGDATISRENHAAVGFDDEQNAFFVGHGGKANLVRLNGRPVLSTEDLRHGDVLRIGDTELRFVALCGTEFGWGDDAIGAEGD